MAAVPAGGGAPGSAPELATASAPVPEVPWGQQNPPPADLDRAEEVLASREQSADHAERRRAEQEAVLLSIDLADSVARRYCGRGIDADDLVQVARMALVKAARGYRRGKGPGFAAYAVPTISGEIKRYFRDCGWAVRPPRRLQEIRADVAAAEERLRQDLHRDPRPAELAEALGLSESEVREARQCAGAYQAVSLDVPAPTGAPAHEVVAVESEVFDRLEVRAALGAAVCDLSERERTILRLRFVEERTQSEIGAVLGVSQMQVSRLLSGILRRLRASMVESGCAA